MARPTTKIVFVIMSGKRPIAAFRNRSNAEISMSNMMKFLPKSMMQNFRLRIETVPVQG